MLSGCYLARGDAQSYAASFYVAIQRLRLTLAWNFRCDGSLQLRFSQRVPALQDTEGPVEQEVTPIYVALVDTTGGEEYLELVKSALLAALEALPSCALFGLATYNDQVCLMTACRWLCMRLQLPHKAYHCMHAASMPKNSA